MAVTTNLGVPKRGGRISFGIDEPKLREQFFGLTRFEFGDDPHGPLMVVQVIPPDLEFATHFHDTDYCTLVLEGALRVGRTWYSAGQFRVQDAKSVYGPSLSGPDGCTVVSFYGDRSELPDKFTRDADRERFEQLLPTLLAAYSAAGMGTRPDPDPAPEPEPELDVDALAEIVEAAREELAYPADETGEG